MPINPYHERQALMAHATGWLDLLDLTPAMRRELAALSAPASATARHWIDALAVGKDGDPGDLRLRFALLIAAETPSLTEDSSMATRLATMITAWATQALTLTQENRAAHANHLLSLAPLVDAFPDPLVAEAIEYLWQMLDDGNWRVKQAAQRVLTSLPAHLDGNRVQQLIGSTDEMTCKLGLALAGSLRARAPISAMLVAMRRDATKWEAAQALIALGDAAPLAPLLKIAAHHPNPNMRAAVIKALSTLKDRVEIDEIVRLIQSNIVAWDPNVLFPWADRLPIQMLVDGLFISEYALTLLLPASVRRRDEIPIAAIRQLQHAPLTRTHVQLEGASTRYTAARILLALGETVELAPLVEAVSLDSRQVSRSQGLRVLASLGAAAPIERIVTLLAPGPRNHESLQRRIATASALTAPIPQLPLEPLLDLLHEDDSQARHAALLALRAQGPRTPISVWRQELTGDWPAYALLALAAYDNAPPDGALMQAFWRIQESPMRGIRWGNSTESDELLASIYRAWGPRITPDHVAPQTINLATMRAQAAMALGSALNSALDGERTRAAFDALVAATDDPDANVRAAAVRGLGVRTPLAIVQRLANDAERSVREVATALLGQLAARPVEALLARCQAPERAERVSALLALGHDAPPDLIIQNLADDRESIDLALLDLLVAIDSAAAYRAVMAIRQQTGRGHLRALGRLGAQAPLEILREALFDDSYYNPSTDAVVALLDLGQLHDAADPTILAQAGEVLATALDAANTSRGRKGERDFDASNALMEVVERLPPRAGLALLAAFARGDTEYRFTHAPAQFPQARDYQRIITKTLTSRQDWVRESAALALLRGRGHTPLALITDALQDVDGAVRQIAAWLLGKIGDASVIPSLRAAVADRAAGHVAAVALRRLGVTDISIPQGSNNPFQSFEPPVYEDEDNPESSASLSVERLVWAVGERWNETNAVETLRVQAPTELAALVPDAVTTLRGAPTGVFSSQARILCAALLTGIQADATRFEERLLDLLDWPYAPVRVQALQTCSALTGSWPDALIARVKTLLGDPDARVRAAAEDAVADLVA